MHTFLRFHDGEKKHRRFRIALIRRLPSFPERKKYEEVEEVRERRIRREKENSREISYKCVRVCRYVRSTSVYSVDDTSVEKFCVIFFASMVRKGEKIESEGRRKRGSVRKRGDDDGRKPRDEKLKR